MTRPPRQYFSCAKSISPVPCAGGIGHDLLVQFSLEPEIIEIGHIDRLACDGMLVDVDAVTIRRRSDGKQFAVDSAGLRRRGGLVDEDLAWAAADVAGFERLPVSRAEITAEPLFSNARAVWAYRDFAIDTRMRFEIVAALHEDGPLRFHELCLRVSGPRDPVATLLAMTCSNLLEIDVCDVLDHSTLVRVRA